MSEQERPSENDGCDGSVADRSVAQVAHDMVNAVMAIDLLLGVLEAGELADSVLGLREPTDELLELVRELDALVRPTLKSE